MQFKIIQLLVKNSFKCDLKNIKIYYYKTPIFLNA